MGGTGRALNLPQWDLGTSEVPQGSEEEFEKHGLLPKFSDQAGSDC